MSPKETYKEQKVYFMDSDGKLSHLGMITELNEDNIENAAEIAGLFDEMTFTVEAKINHLLFKYIAGMGMSNNWRKMHKLPMRRKGR